MCARFGGSQDHVFARTLSHFCLESQHNFLGILHITDGRGNRNYVTKMEQARNSLYPDADDDDDDDDRFFKNSDTFRVSCVRNFWN